MIWGFISSLGSTIMSGVSSAISAIGSAISTTVSRALEVIVSAAETVLPIIAKIAEALGIISPQEDPVEIGDRALQAADMGIKPEDYASHMEYMDALRNFDLDPEKSKKYTPEEKAAAAALTLGQGISEKTKISLETLMPLMAMSAVNSHFFNDTRLRKIIEGGAPLVSTVMRYFEGRLNPQESRDVESTLLNEERKTDPQRSEADFYQDLDAARNDFRNHNKNQAESE